MPTYDFCCIASAKISNQHLINLISKISADVNKRGGVIRRIEHYGLRPLAYKIQSHSHKHDVGRYFRMFVQASPLSAKEDVAFRLKVDEGILRFRPFKVNMQDIFDVPKTRWLHKPKLTDGHYDALSRSTNIDYYIARTLLKTGKMTPEEIMALGTHSIALEPEIALHEKEAALRAFNTEEIDGAEPVEHIDDLLNEDLTDGNAEDIYSEDDVFKN